MKCTICDGMGCDSCGQLGEQSLSHEDWELQQCYKDKAALQELLKKYIDENGELKAQLERLAP